MSLFSKDIAVLNVTSHLISAIVGTKKAQSVFGIKAIKEKQHQGYMNAEWLDLADTVSTAKSVISDAMKSAASRTKRLFIGVPAEFATVVTRTVDISYDKKRRIVDDDIDYLMQKGNSFDVGNKYTTINMSAIYFTIEGRDRIYGDVRGEEAKGLSALVSYMLADRRFVDVFDAVANELGFTDVRYISTEWAQCVNLLDNEQRDNVYVLIDIGYISSSVCIAKGDGILEMKAFSLGGAHISADFTDFLGVSFEMAEEARKLLDLNLDYKPDTMLVSNEDGGIKAVQAAMIARERIDMFADVINQIFYGSRQNLPETTPIYLTGEGLASMRGAKKYLSELLDRNIEILTSRLPGFVKPEDSSKACVLIMADTLSKSNMTGFIKKLIGGGKTNV